MRVSQNEINILRQLGEKYMNYASLPIQREKLRMWKALNAAKHERPMVVIDQGPWHELAVTHPEQLKCQVADPYWREIERTLRTSIFQWENFPGDMVLEPFITIPAAISGYFHYMAHEGYQLEFEQDIMPQEECASSDYISTSSYKYKNSINSIDELHKIKDIKLTKDDKQSEINLQEAQHIFSGIAPIKLSHGVHFHLGIWDLISMYMGVEDVYFAFIERPEFLHAVLRRFTDATLSGIKDANDLKINNDIISQCHCGYTYCDDLLPDFGVGKGTDSAKNCWAFGLAQLFTSVGPATFEEFELPYIAEMAKEFGAIYYGCCEKIDDRLDLVHTIPNLRKVSCSPWSDRDNFARNLNKNLVMSSKPMPAFLAGESIDEKVIREDLEHTIRTAKENGLALELILKDLSTIKSDLSRLQTWNKIAMELVEK